MNPDRVSAQVPDIADGVSTNAASSAKYPLSSEQMQFFEDNGYLVIKKLIALPALDKYRQRFVDICNGRVNRKLFSIVKDRSLYRADAKPEDFINKIQELLYDEVFSTYSEDPRLVHVVSQLIGEGITALNGMLINKPPGTGAHPPHQDLLYIPHRPVKQSVATWTAIDPVNQDNGCLYMVPGSHKREEIFKHVKHDRLYYRLEDEEILAPEEKRINLEMEPGDTVLISSLIIHGSRANVSKSYRKCMATHYVNSNCHLIDVTGTIQDQVAKDMVMEFSYNKGHFSFNDLWSIKSKKITGVKSSL